jgi:hypothetical protein
MASISRPPTRVQSYDFLGIFANQIGRNIGNFDFLKNYAHKFEENRPFFAENWSKLPTVVIITLSPGQSQGRGPRLVGGRRLEDGLALELDRDVDGDLG